MAMIFCSFNLYVLTYYEKSIAILEFFIMVKDPFSIAAR